jgi:hypothetical protein
MVVKYKIPREWEAGDWLLGEDLRWEVIQSPCLFPNTTIQRTGLKPEAITPQAPLEPEGVLVEHSDKKRLLTCSRLYHLQLFRMPN